MEVKVIDDLLGLPFIDGGRGPDGYDCWGLAREVYKRYGIELPNYPVAATDFIEIDKKITEEKKEWEKVEKPYPVPSLVVLRLNCANWANHVGVYIGNGKFIHAYVGSGVVIEKLNHAYWKHRILGVYVPRGEFFA